MLSNEVWNAIKAAADHIGAIALSLGAIYALVKGLVVPGSMFDRERARADGAELRLADALKVTATHQGVLSEIKDSMADMRRDIRDLPTRMPGRGH